MNFKESKYKEPEIGLISETKIKIDSNYYQVIDNYKKGLDVKALRNRFVDLFLKFDYIFGDWSYDQLRLTGFYERKSANKGKSILTCADFLSEFGAFDCPYFLLKKIESEEKYEI